MEFYINTHVYLFDAAELIVSKAKKFFDFSNGIRSAAILEVLKAK